MSRELLAMSRAPSGPWVGRDAREIVTAVMDAIFAPQLIVVVPNPTNIFETRRNRSLSEARRKRRILMNCISTANHFRTGAKAWRKNDLEAGKAGGSEESR